MKISKRQLKKLIQEEKARLVESPESMNQVYEVSDRLEEIQAEIGDLANEAFQMLRSLPREEWGREVESARSYWYGHIMSALGGEVGGDYARGQQDTIQDTINALNESGLEDEDY